MYDESKLNPDGITQNVEKAGHGATSKKDHKDKTSKTAVLKSDASVELGQMKTKMYASMIFLIILMYITVGSKVGMPLPDVIGIPKNAAANVSIQVLLTFPIMYINRKSFIRGVKALIHLSPNMDSLIVLGISAIFIHGMIYLYQIIYFVASGDFSRADHHKQHVYFVFIAMILAWSTLGKYFETRAKMRISDNISKFADKVSGIFVPIVMTISMLTLLVWLLLGADFTDALKYAIYVLVISCPCALGLATPAAILVGTQKGARLGILVKSTDALEILKQVEVVVLDKTSTVTNGKQVVTDIVLYEELVQGDDKDIFEDGFLTNHTFGPKMDYRKDNAFDAKRLHLLSLAASIESASEHPLAKVIVEHAKEENATLLDVSDFQEKDGSGIRANLGDKTYYAGNRRMLNALSKSGKLDSKESCIRFIEIGQGLSMQGKTPLYFVENGRILGIIAVADAVKPDAKEAILELKKCGLEVILLTGDNENNAKAIAKETGIDHVFPRVLPDQKEEMICALMEQGKKVAMVGDKVDDAPALARADVGIAIGGGTDIATESADIVLMHSSLMDVVNAIDLSKAIIQKMKQNVFWAFFYNVLCIPLAAGLFVGTTGWTLNSMFGVAAMILSSISIVTNALMLKGFQKKKYEVKL